jgi:ATP-dependent DNA ligase
MFKAFEFCLPIKGTKVAASSGWFHEIKYDGYRIRLERDRDRVRLITRGGNDWTSRFPWIGEAALKNRIRQFVIDGEAVILGVDGVSDFNALHSGKYDHAHSTSSSRATTTCASYRCIFARPISPAYWRGDRTASLSCRTGRDRS